MPALLQTLDEIIEVSLRAGVAMVDVQKGDVHCPWRSHSLEIHRFAQRIMPGRKLFLKGTRDCCVSWPIRESLADGSDSEAGWIFLTSGSISVTITSSQPLGWSPSPATGAVPARR